MKNKLFAAGAVLALAICTCFSYKHASAPPAKEEQIIEFEKKMENNIFSICKINIESEMGNASQLLKTDGYIGAEIRITDNDNNQINEFASGKIRVRGNSTAWAEKKPYTIKFDKKQDLFGMGKAKRWNLLANAYDPTLVRNFIALKLAADMKLPSTPEFKVAEVVVDNRYMGTYLMTEAVEARKGRLELDEKKGDYLIEVDSYRRDDEAEYLYYDGISAVIHYPEEPSEEIFEKINDSFMDIMETVNSGTFEEIKEKVDVKEMAEFLLFNEYVKTVDFGLSSTFFYFRNGKLHAGPVWDYDGSMGLVNPEYNLGYERAGSTVDNFGDRAIFYYLLKHEEFNQLMREAYAKYRDMFADLYETGGITDQAVLTFRDYFEYDFSPEVWNVAERNANLEFFRKPDPTYQENVDFMKNWLKERQAAMDEYYRN